MWAPDYVTVAQLRHYLRITDTEDDAELAFSIGAASRAIEDHTKRQFGVVDVAEDRMYVGRCRKGGDWVARIDDLQTTAGVTVNSGAITEFEFQPFNAIEKGRVYERLVIPSGDLDLDDPTVTVNALWGWSAVPTTIEQATLLQASRFHARRFSPFGVAGSPDEGSEMRLLARLDPDVKMSIEAFERDRLVFG